MRKERWIVVGDSSRCRIFSQPRGTGPLREIGDLVHGASRLAGEDLVTDRPGRSFDSAGPGRHAMEPPSDPNEHEAVRFARQIGDALEKARTGHRFDSLVLIVEPRFLGRLRDELTAPLDSMVEAELAAHLTQADEETLRAKLDEILA